MSTELSRNWYIIQVRSSCEKKVAQTIKQILALENIGHLVESIIIPVEKVIEIKRGKKVEVEKRFLPGYVLLKAEMNDKLWHTVISIKDVIKFLGSSDKPSPIPQAEVDRIFSQMKDGTNINSKKIAFNIGDYVKVIDGPFESFVGVIEGIDEANGRLKVSMSIFGRPTPVDLEFTQVTKDRE